MLADEINRTNKVSYTKCIQIAFRINPGSNEGGKGATEIAEETIDEHADSWMSRKKFTKYRQARGQNQYFPLFRLFAFQLFLSRV